MNRKIALVMALSLLNPVLVMAAQKSNSDPTSPIAGAAECDTAMMECYITGNDGGATKYTYEEAATLLGQYVGPVTAGVSCEPFMPVCMNGGREVLGANPSYDMAAAQAAQAAALGESNNSSQPAVQQATELPLEIQYRNGDLYFTAIVDNVTINKVTINRGNCKTLDYKTPRDAELAHRAKYPKLQKGVLGEIAATAGVLKYGEVQKSSAGYNCVPRELVVDTDQGSWNVTLTLTSN